MTRAEQEAFEKWMGDKYGDDAGYIGLNEIDEHREIFLAGYRAGFEAQHYEVDDGTRTD